MQVEAPRRDSLSVQTAAAIRKGLDQGAWPSQLPGERRLCEMLQVSRPILRAALRQLAREGRLKISQGCPTRVVGRRPAPAPGHRVVAVVTQQPLARVPQFAAHVISDLRARLTELGFATEVLVCPRGSPRMQHRRIAELMRQHRVGCCALLSASRELQAWFAEHPVAALVIGSCHQSISLPSLAVDFRSVCRHATGVFLAKGHSRLALVVPDSGLAGDLASEQGFLEGARSRPNGHQPAATVVRHDGTALDITRQLDALFATPQAPTALLVARPAHVFAVIVYLLRRGLPVPDQISLIARDPDALFESTEPLITHYQLSADAFSARAVRLMLKLARGGALPRQPSLIIPGFVAGGTVGAPPS